MKRVLITGASSGIGLQLARDYAADGWHVIACGRSQQKLEAQHAGHAHIDICTFDITDWRRRGPPFPAASSSWRSCAPAPVNTSTTALWKPKKSTA